MQKNISVRTLRHKKDEIEKKLQYGDYTTLAQILRTTTEAARKRFERLNPRAIEAMDKIVESREKLIEQFKDV